MSQQARQHNLALQCPTLPRLDGLRRQASVEARHHYVPIVALGHQEQRLAVPAVTMWARNGLVEPIALSTFEDDQHALIVPPLIPCVQMTLVPWGNQSSLRHGDDWPSPPLRVVYSGAFTSEVRNRKGNTLRVAVCFSESYWHQHFRSWRVGKHEYFRRARWWICRNSESELQRRICRHRVTNRSFRRVL